MQCSYWTFQRVDVQFDQENFDNNGSHPKLFVALLLRGAAPNPEIEATKLTKPNERNRHPDRTRPLRVLRAFVASMFVLRASARA